jgi:bile acid-coenzyme A ligase
LTVETKTMSPTPMPVPLTVELSRQAEAQPNRTAITCGTSSVTFRELDRRTNRLARAFAAHGVHRDAFVTIALPNCIAYYEAVIAAWKLGATPQPVSARMPAPEREAILNLVQPKLVVGLAMADCAGWPSYRPGSEDDQSDAPLPPVVAASFKAPTSGGSTGRPKLIVSTQPATVDALAPLAAILRMKPNGVHLVTGPLHHNGPLLMSMCALLQGNHLVVMPRFDAAGALALIEQHRVDWMYAVPTMMQRIWRLPDADRIRHDLSSLRMVMHLAAPCPPWLKQVWIDWLGADRVWELYAATEVQAITLISGGEWLEHKGSVGKPVVGEIQILDAEGDRVPEGQVGEVWMRRGPDQPGGPYRYVGAVARARPGGWESVGDMGHLDAQGYLYLADRQSDMILVGGSNVYPAEIEAALEAHPAVASACVVGLPDDDLGSVPHAIVQLAPGGGPVPDAVLLEHCRTRLSGYKVPRSFERVDQPLRDEAGKVRRSALRAERLASRATQVMGAVLLALGLFACGGAHPITSPDDGGNKVDAGPGDAGMSADAGQLPDGGARPDGGTSVCTVTADAVKCPMSTLMVPGAAGVMRNVNYQLPNGSAPANGWPVVVLFQGSFFGASLFFQATSGALFGGYYEALTTAQLLDRGFAVLAPETHGNNTYWDTNQVPWVNAWDGAPDDIFMKAIFAAIEAGTFGPLDPHRWYAAGISSGGYMTSRMAVSYSGRFKALAVHSASYATCGGPLCTVPSVMPPAHPPTFFLHGGSDPAVPIATMELYRDALADAGVPVGTLIDPPRGHEWLPGGPDAIVGWFTSH